MDLFDDRVVARNARIARLPEAWIEELQVIADDLQAHEAGMELAETLYAVVMERAKFELKELPETQVLGPHARALNLLVLLAGVPHCQGVHEELKLPPKVTADTIADIRIWAGECRSRHGFPGVENPQLVWISNYLKGKLFCIGRLQYRHQEEAARAFVFRHRREDRHVVMPPAGHFFDADGNRLSTSEGAVWESDFVETDDGWRGHKACPDGTAERSMTLLEKADWERVVKPDDSVLDVHIPAGPGLSPEAVTQSFDMAERFFGEYFPEQRFQAFACQAWLLDPQLRQFLPPDSNIVRFQDQFLQRPTYGGDKAGIERIFGWDAVGMPVAKLPQISSLQRAAAAFMAKGGRLGMGAGIRLPSNRPAS